MDDELCMLYTELNNQTLLINEQNTTIAQLKQEIQELKNIIATLTKKKVKRGEFADQITGNFDKLLEHNIRKDNLEAFTNLLFNYNIEYHYKFLLHIFVGADSQDVPFAIIDRNMIVYKINDEVKYIEMDNFINKLLKPMIETITRDYVSTLIKEDVNICIDEMIENVKQTNNLQMNYNSIYKCKNISINKLIKQYQDAR